MREPYWHDMTATLYVGDTLEVLREMADGSVDCIVTSPPAWAPQHADTQPAQSYGNQPTAALYIAALRRVFTEARRVLADQGTAWLTVSDHYAVQTGRTGTPSGRYSRTIHDQAMTGIPVSSLIGLPWQLAFALHDDGWIIRNAIVCHHPTTEPAPLPDDRFATSYELIFLLVKQQQYYFDTQARCRYSAHPNTAGTPSAAARSRPPKRHAGAHGKADRVSAVGNCPNQDLAATAGEGQGAAAYRSGRQPVDLWAVQAWRQTDMMPIEVPLCCIAAGCGPGGTVLDLFAGTATTGIAARQLDRRYIGIELSNALCQVAKTRLSQPPSSEDPT